MKRIALFLVVLFAAFESLSAQATMDLKINYDVNGKVIKEEVEPDYYPEAGIIKVIITLPIAYMDTSPISRKSLPPNNWTR